jgi:osmotically inducible protein OsmC
MVVRTARASWAPDSHGGGGNIRAESGALSAEYSLNSRFGADPGTNPEELLGAAHAACFNLALAGALTKAGLETAAEVGLDKVPGGFRISTIQLITVGEVPGIDQKEFEEQAHLVKLGCPVSKALSGTDIFLESKLV